MVVIHVQHHLLGRWLVIHIGLCNHLLAHYHLQQRRRFRSLCCCCCLKLGFFLWFSEKPKKKIWGICWIKNWERLCIRNRCLWVLSLLWVWMNENEWIKWACYVTGFIIREKVETWLASNTDHANWHVCILSSLQLRMGFLRGCARHVNARNVSPFVF